MSAPFITGWVIVQLTIASISVTAGGLTLFTIYDMSRERPITGFLMLVASLSSAQLLYDLGFFFDIQSNSSVHDALFYVCSFNKIFFQMFGGIATTLITNSIACIVASIAFSLRSYDIKAKFSTIMGWVLVIAFLPAITSAVLFLKNPDSLSPAFSVIYIVYSGVRVASILVNIVLCAMLTVKLNSMGLYLFQWTDGANPVHPVAALSSRMILYPVVQVITRVGAAWMEFGYPIVGADETTPDYKAAFALFSVFSPAGGVGFFFIFISMQPIARRHLYDRLSSLCSSCKIGGEDPGSPDIKARLLNAHGDGVSVVIPENHESGSAEDSHLTGSAGNSINVNAPPKTNPIPGRNSRSSRNSRTSKEFVPRSGNPQSRGGSVAISRSHSGVDPAFLPGALNTLDDDELGLLVDRLAEEHMHTLHDGSGYPSGISGSDSGRALDPRDVIGSSSSFDYEPGASP